MAQSAAAAAAVEAKILELVEGYHRIMSLHNIDENVRPAKRGVSKNTSKTTRSKFRDPQAANFISSQDCNNSNVRIVMDERLLSQRRMTSGVEEEEDCWRSLEPRVRPATTAATSRHQHHDHGVDVITTRRRVVSRPPIVTTSSVDHFESHRDGHCARCDSQRRQRVSSSSAAKKSAFSSSPGAGGGVAVLTTKSSQQGNTDGRRNHNKASKQSSHAVKTSTGFIRSQIHTCRLGSGGRGSSLSCAACSGVASIQHARFLERDRLYASNLSHAVRAGLVDVIDAPTTKRPTRRHVMSLE